MSGWDHAGIALMLLCSYATGYLIGWLRAQDRPTPPQAGPEADDTCCTPIHTAASGMTSLTPAMLGVEQRADGSWWLVLATIKGAGLPDGEQITPQQAMRIARLLRQVRWDGGN